MASKKCLICNSAFIGRSDAKTCSMRCRKRLQKVRLSFAIAPAKKRLAKSLTIFMVSLFSILSIVLGANSSTTSAATSSYLNFQARLLTNPGNLVADGNYNVEFKIYKSLAAGGSAQGTCAGGVTDDCLWVETRTGANKVRVANGYLTVNLGSVNAFPSTINWDQQLYLSMNIGGTGAPGWDGEMSPRITLTALPYAFRAGTLAKTDGSGNVGTLSFNTTANSPVITLPDATGTVCLQTSVSCGFLSSTTGVQLQATTPGSQQTGHFNISGTGIVGTALQSPLVLTADQTAGSTSSSAIVVRSGDVSGATSNSGSVTLRSGNSSTSGDTGSLAITSGNATSGTAGNVTIDTGTTTAGTPTLNLGSSNAKAVQIGNNTSNPGVTIDSGTGIIAVGTGAQARTVNIGTGAAQQVVTVGSTNGGSSLLLQAGTGNLQLTTQGTGTLGIGNNAVAQNIAIGNGSGGTNVTISCGTGSCLFGTNATDHTTTLGSLTGSSATTLQGGTSGVNVGTGGIANTIQIGNTTGAVAQTINIGNNSTASSTNNVNIGSSIAGTTAVTGATTITNRTSGSADTFVVNNSTSTGTIAKFQDNATSVFSLADGGAATFQNQANSTTAFQVQNSVGSNLLNIDTSTTLNLVTNGDIEGQGTGGWTAKGSSTLSAVTTQQWQGNSSLSVATTAANNDGAKYAFTFTPSATYSLSLYAKVASGSISDVNIGRQDNGSDIDCLTGQTLTTSWMRFNCAFNAGATISGSSIHIKKTGGSAETFFIDGVQLETGSTTTVFNPGGALQLSGIVNSPLTIQNKSNSSTAFQINSSTGSNLFNVDTSNSYVINSGISTPGNELQNPSFEADGLNSGWTLSGGSVLSKDTTNAHSGNRVMAVGTGGAGGSSFGDNKFYDVLVGHSYEFGGWVKTGGSANGTDTTFVFWYDKDRGFLSSSSGASITNSTTYAQFKTIFVAPSNAVYATFGITDSAAHTTGTWYYDDLYLSGDTHRESPIYQNSVDSTTAFQIQNALGSNVLSVDTTALSTLNTNGSAEGTDISAWSSKQNATVTRDTTQTAYLGSASIKTVLGGTTAIGDGVKYTLPSSIGAATYTLSFSIEQTAGTAFGTNLQVGYNNGSDNNCTLAPTLSAQAVPTTGWARYSCTFTTTGTTTFIYWKEADAPASARTFFLDAVQLETGSTANAFKETGIALNGVINSAVSFKNQADSTNALQIQKSNGTELLRVDTLNNKILLNNISTLQVQNTSAGSLFSIDGTNSNITFNSNNGGEVQTWQTSANQLPTKTLLNTSIILNGYMYVIGGLDTSSAGLTAVNYAKLNADGSTSTWTSTSVLPDFRYDPASTTANGYIYVIGGGGTSGITNTVYYARQNADGTLGAWNLASNTLPGIRRGLVSTAVNGYLYAIGGSTDGTNANAQSTVYYAKLNADGSTGTWQTSSANPLTTAVQSASIGLANGRIYIIGGAGGAGNSTTIQYATLNADGTTGSWSTSTITNGGTTNHVAGSAAIVNSYLYLVGANSTGPDLWYAKLNSNGSVPAFTTSTKAPPGSRKQFGSTPLVANGYIYLPAGTSSFNVAASAQQTVYYTSTPRISAAGSIDLVGTSGQDLQDGGSQAGSLTAGNTEVLGNLGVRGQANLLQGASIYNGLSVSGSTFVKGLSASSNIFQVQNAGGVAGFNITTANLVGNTSFEGGVSGATPESWAAKGSGVPTVDNSQVDFGTNSMKVVTTTAANDGAKYNYPFLASTQYTLSLYAKVSSGSITDFVVGRQETGSDSNCLTGQTVNTSWTRFTCTFTTGASITGTPSIYIQKSGGTAETFFIDGVQLETAAAATTYRETDIKLDGQITFKNSADSTTAFQIQNAAGTSNLLIADTLNGRLGVGTNAPLATFHISSGGTDPLFRVTDTTATARDVLNIADGGAVTFRNQTDSTTAFQLQNADASATLFTADTSGLVIKIAGKTTTFAILVVDNGHFKSTQTNIPTIGTPSSCGTSPSAAVTTGSTDSAGSFTITAGTAGGYTTCDTVFTFNKAYGAAPKAVIVTPTTAVGASPAGRTVQVTATSTTTFTVKLTANPTVDGEVNGFYYWIIE